MIKNYAHRGFSGKYPENTMLAFEKAYEAGCDGIELDVHFSKDRELVIIHDELVDRTTDGHGLVGDFSLKELKQLDAAANFPGEVGKHEIPTLQEYLSWVKDLPIATNIELKTGVYTYPGIEEKVLEMVDEFGLREKTIISSFNHYSVMKMKKLAPDIVCGFLEESWIIGMTAYCHSHGIEGVHPIFNAVDEKYMQDAAKHGIKVNVWTVNEEADIRRMAELGVDIIIGNYPDLCGKVLKSPG